MRRNAAALLLAGASALCLAACSGSEPAAKLVGAQVDNYMLVDQTGMSNILRYDTHTPAVVLASYQNGDKTSQEAAKALQALKEKNPDLVIQLINSSNDDTRETIAEEAKAQNISLPILDGGRNDQFVPPEARFEVTASAIAQAHQTWPNARIVFVAPRFLDRPADDLDVNEKTIDQLKKASGFKDLVVVDPAAGFKDRDTAALISSDGTKPSPEGEQALAAALADDLKRNGFEPAT